MSPCRRGANLAFADHAPRADRTLTDDEAAPVVDAIVEAVSAVPAGRCGPADRAVSDGRRSTPTPDSRRTVDPPVKKDYLTVDAIEPGELTELLDSRRRR